MVANESLKHLLKMGVRATGLQSFKHLIKFFFGMGTMVDFLKHEGTTDRDGQMKLSVKTPARWNSHARSTRPGMPSRPTAFRMFTRLKDRVTSATERESGLTSSAAAAGALSVWVVFQPRNEHKKVLSSSGREQCSLAGLFPLKPVMLLMPCHMLLALLVINCSSTLFLYCRLAALMDLLRS